MMQTLTPADRIRDLSSINEEIALMLKAAGLAVNILSGRPAPTNDEDETMADSTTTLDSSKATFEAHVTDYYTRLQAIIARLRRQAYALEEAGIISAESAALASTTTVQQTARNATNGITTEPVRITNGGLGNLDIGWLNSRGNKVAAEKENEIMNDMKTLLEDALARDAENESAG